MMRKTFYLAMSLLLITLLIIPNIAAGKSKLKLPPRWKKWIDEEVGYIITPKEKKVFKSLKSEKERQSFEQLFWQQRDPTPGTRRNEAKDEHYKRLRYATEYFGRGTIKYGWETDRGRIYIILGEPVDTQRFYETSAGLVPTELWQYHGDTSLGLPPFFYIIFYQDRGIGDYKLYSPSFDGPQRLIQAGTQANLDRYNAYQQVKEASAELAEATLSYIPGTGGDPHASTASLSSDMLMANIQNIPQKKVESEWADAFLKHKEIVTTDYSHNYVGSNSVLFIHQENRRNYLHTIIEPHRLSMSQFDETVYAPLKLNIKISDLSGNMVYQREKDMDIEMSPEDFKKIERRLVAAAYISPLVGGNFTVNALLRNTTSKEFSSLEETVTSPPLSGIPSLSPLLFLFDARKVQTKMQTMAFIFRDLQLSPNTRKLYTKNDDLILYFEIYNPSRKLRDYNLKITISLGENVIVNRSEPIGDQRYFLKRYALNDFKPGYYDVRITVADNSGKEIMKEKSEFNLSPVAMIPRPWTIRKIYPPLHHPYFSLMRGAQYLGLKKYDLVIQEIEKLYNKDNPDQQTAVMLAGAYYNKGHYPRVIEILDPLKELQELEVLKLIAQSYYQLKNFESALEYFQKALITGGEIVEILNYIGYCHFQLNNPKESLKYLERSLRINSDQPDVTKIVEKIKREKQEEN